jgi:hypothetical protein
MEDYPMLIYYHTDGTMTVVRKEEKEKETSAENDMEAENELQDCSTEKTHK